MTGIDFELPALAKASVTSHIDAGEEKIARELIDAQFKELTGHPMDMRPTGFYLALKVWVPPEKIGNIYLSETFRDDRKFTSAVGLVCALGPDAYKGERFEKTGPWCKVGDWVIFPRYEGNAMSYRGVGMILIPDDRILSVVADPAEIASINEARKF